MKRLFDLFASLFLMALLALPAICIFFAIRLTSEGSAIYWSDRVGRENKIFKMPKFRTMKVGTPIVATHLLNNSHECLTFFGMYLRKYSLDEIPQLWSIFIGDMSFVGPRPALFNQADLIKLRSKYGVDQLVPGLTGWAQVNGRDELTIPIKVRYEVEYLNKKSFFFDLKVLLLTLLRVIKSTGVSH